MQTSSETSRSRDALGLLYHVYQKGFQTGGLLGLGVTVPLVAYRVLQPIVAGTAGTFEQRDAIAHARTCLRGAAYGAAAGGSAVGVAAAVRFTRISPDELRTRARKLAANSNAQRAERFGQVGMVLGAAATAVLLIPQGSATFLDVIGGSAIGSQLGAMVHKATRPAAPAPPPAG